MSSKPWEEVLVRLVLTHRSTFFSDIMPAISQIVVDSATSSPFTLQMVNICEEQISGRLMR